MKIRMAADNVSQAHHLYQLFQPRRQDRAELLRAGQRPIEIHTVGSRPVAMKQEVMQLELPREDLL
jgi:hypothetical protein